TTGGIEKETKSNEVFMPDAGQLVLYSRELFKTISNDGQGDCGPAALWQLIYGGRPTSRDLKEMRNQAVDEVYSHPSRYMDFFGGETAARRKGMLYKWTRKMKEKGTWADQLFVNAIARAHEVNIRILVPEKNNTLRDEQGNYAGQGAARRTYYMLHTAGCHFEALKALGEVEPIDGWTVQEVRDWDCW
ncbi:unnamed protein product, partial [Pylaiella littoralis]